MNSNQFFESQAKSLLPAIDKYCSENGIDKGEESLINIVIDIIKKRLFTLELASLYTAVDHGAYQQLSWAVDYIDANYWSSDEKSEDTIKRYLIELHQWVRESDSPDDWVEVFGERGKEIINSGVVETRQLHLEEMLVQRCPSFRFYQCGKDFIDALDYYNDNVYKIEESASIEDVFELLRSNPISEKKILFFLFVFEHRNEDKESYHHLMQSIVTCFSAKDSYMDKWGWFYDKILTTSGAYGHFK